MNGGDRKVVLDASALVAWIYRETGYQVIARALPVSVVAVPNAVETLARAAERGYDGTSTELLTDLQRVGVELEPTLADDVVRAADLIAQSRRLGIAQGHGISLGDGLCLAVSERLNLTVVGGDRAWDKLDLRVPYRMFRK